MDGDYGVSHGTNGEHLPQTREEALALGSPRYMTFLPCRNGHVAFRNTKSGKCSECTNAKTREFRKTPKGQLQNRTVVARHTATERGRKLKKARNAARRAWKKRATPKWADREIIAQFYIDCPDGYHVDHILPLKSKVVCGLHTLENLQHLPAEENSRKKNLIDPFSLQGNVCVLPERRQYFGPRYFLPGT